MWFYKHTYAFKIGFERNKYLFELTQLITKKSENFLVKYIQYIVHNNGTAPSKWILKMKHSKFLVYCMPDHK